MLRSRLPAFLFLLWTLLLAPAVLAQSDTAEVSPQQAREVLDTLQDDERRDEVVRTLEAIASEAPVEEQPVVEDSPLSTIVPLEEGGLIARTLDQVANWADGLRAQLVRIADALNELPDWFQATFLNELGRMLLMQTLLDLAIVFGAGLCLEWLLRRLLRRAVRSLMHSAHQADVRTPLAAAGMDGRWPKSMTLWRLPPCGRWMTIPRWCRASAMRWTMWRRCR